MHNAIQKFSETILQLLDLLEIVFERGRKRSKRAVASVKLSEIGCSDIHLLNFDNYNRVIEDQVTIAHWDNEKRLYIYTDASDSVRSGVVTQVPCEDFSKPHIDQR